MWLIFRFPKLQAWESIQYSLYEVEQNLEIELEFKYGLLLALLDNSELTNLCEVKFFFRDWVIITVAKLIDEVDI